MIKTILRTMFIAASLLALASTANAAPIDQSQLSFNTGVPFEFSFATVTNYPLGQSFTAGKTGLLTDIYLGSNGGIQNGGDTLTMDIHSGNGIGGALLGHSTVNVSSIWTPSVNQWLITIDTTALGINVVAGNQYTFDFTAVTGPGDLAYRGILGNTNNPYAGGRIYTGAGYGNQPNWDLVFETAVDTNNVPEPAPYALLLVGALALIGFAARKRQAN
ncbi:PEP-CTERM sorting domain-containing protein [Sapientia aquatica]|uniref:PEP-CTERM sorting domain-containing protein n=1 Tax=Sapientia aquatica TaxID=1549640 RepID=A0A4R5W389_9BURK|nr:PEP-CTERM sorting domain-containing protein [Sapientia aquatica]TDK65669.1 PEP-CTERM sorting domain-containing protein [Sapientia aquatica]